MISLLFLNVRSSFNQLEEIPDLSALTEITELRFSHNNIKKIPASIAKLSTWLWPFCPLMVNAHA